MSRALSREFVCQLRFGCALRPRSSRAFVALRTATASAGCLARGGVWFVFLGPRARLPDVDQSGLEHELLVRSGEVACRRSATHRVNVRLHPLRWLCHSRQTPRLQSQSPRRLVVQLVHRCDLDSHGGGFTPIARRRHLPSVQARVRPRAIGREQPWPDPGLVRASDCNRGRLVDAATSQPYTLTRHTNFSNVTSAYGKT